MKSLIAAFATFAAISLTTAVSAQPRVQDAYSIDWRIEEQGAAGWEVLSSGSMAAPAPRKGKWSEEVGFSIAGKKPYLAAVETRFLENGKEWKTPIEATAEYGTDLKVRFRSGKSGLPVKVEFKESKLVGPYDGFDRATLGGSTIMLREIKETKLSGKNVVKPGEWAYPLSTLPSNYRVAIKVTPVS